MTVTNQATGPDREKPAYSIDANIHAAEVMTSSFARLERWQTDYLPVYAVWAAIVVIVFPLVFGYV